MYFVLANSADLDEMPCDAAFYLGFHCLQKYTFRGWIQSTKGSRMTLCTTRLNGLNILMLKKRRPPWTLFKVCFIYIEIRGALKGQRYVDEVLHPHVLQFYQNVGEKNSLSARQCQHTCNMATNCLLAGHVIPPWLVFQVQIHLGSAIPRIF